jgi:bacteriorhodopsin
MCGFSNYSSIIGSVGRKLVNTTTNTIASTILASWSYIVNGRSNIIGSSFCNQTTKYSYYTSNQAGYITKLYVLLESAILGGCNNTLTNSVIQ